ncbi:MBL fold metallo-hydrolase [Hufsiella ginkgonis]|uniref:MBL fold metallo-hydrolase n=1 Tax=Hufsiella ginkgonis TaxID=2695274 RepID=A0A7K1XVG9_9SPHI|nr:MBL fold metallo-hydrolase [Hufsiella ginkgonis]MXV15005.1 MBL fold metallo-hydrolase [Hufsiella ginkgonis]
MVIEQFYDKGLAHSSYAVISSGEMVVIDPARDPQPYLDWAIANQAVLTGVIETHPHADFVSSHLELHQQTGAPIYASKLVDAGYPHITFDEGDEIRLGTVLLRAINTPGHSPDSICILVIGESGKEHAIFTGDTLFAGDVGRPDLRENAGSITARKEELAKDMYHSTREKLLTLPDEVLVYPSHGPGSLCGKNMSPELFSTIGKERVSNYALQDMTETAFVQLITADQPFTPAYFEFDVTINRNGAAPFKQSISAIPQVAVEDLPPGALEIDTRPGGDYKARHRAGSFNIPDGNSFETWLGSVVAPNEPFYLLAGSVNALQTALTRAAKIGYEKQVTGTVVAAAPGTTTSPLLDLDHFKKHMDDYTIVDVRNSGEHSAGKIFENALLLPLPDLRKHLDRIPAGKPVIVHCAGGYRSAIGSSIIAEALAETAVYDLGEAVTGFTGTVAKASSPAVT